MRNVAKAGIFRVAAWLPGLLIGVSCAVVEEPVEHPSAGPEEVGAQDPLAVVFEAVDGYLQAGDVAAALVLMDEHLEALPDGEVKAGLLARQLDVLLSNHLLFEAQRLYLALLAEAPQAAAYVHGIIEEAVERTEGPEALAVWIKRVLKAGPPPRLRAAYARLELQSSWHQELSDAVLERLEEMAGELASEDLAPIVWSHAQRLSKAGRADEAERLQGWMQEGSRGADEHYRLSAALLRPELIIARGQWDDFVAAVTRTLELVDDPEAGHYLDGWCRAALEGDQAPIVDALAGRLLEQGEPFSITVARAARWRLEVARRLNNIDLAISHFAKIMHSGRIAPAYMSSLLGWMSMAVLEDASVEQTRAFLAVNDDLPWLEMEPAARGRHVGILLDISFKAEDYDRMEAILKDGVPQHDQGWHAVMLNKVRAHQAQVAGRTDEAVQRFREFMRQMAASGVAAIVDPDTGRQVTGDMIQALNAQRIGDIYKAAGRPEESAAAYAEARQWYHRAIVEFESDSLEVAWIIERIAELTLSPSN